MRIDSHHHLWTYDPEQYPWISEAMSVLKRNFTVTDLQAVCEATGIDGVVTVQARQSLDETRTLLDIANSEPLVRGVIGWAPLSEHTSDSETNIETVLEEFASNPWLKGVRHVIQDEPDDAFILGQEFNRGLHLLKKFELVYDLLIFPKHLRNTVRCVDQHPEQPFVLDHVAKPAIQTGKFDRLWEENLRELGKRSNVIACKFSGIVTEVKDTSWSVELLRPYWDVALEVLGPERLMFGSDWPVCLLRASYKQWFEAVSSLASELSIAEQECFWYSNACRAYRLS